MDWFNRDKKTPTGSSDKSVERTEEMIRKLLADGEAVEKIVNDYGGVLGITVKMSYGAPESLLPRPKEEIKQAIRVYLLYSHLTKTLDEKFFSVLEAGYSKLSNFMNDTDARNAAACQAAFDYATDRERTAADSVEVAKRISSPEVKAALARHKQAMEEYQALWYEFNAVAKKIGIPFAKTPDQQKEAYAQAATRVAEEVEQLDHLLKAALQGDVLAQCKLGLIYSGGQGVPKDDVKSTSWFRKAAEQGDAMGQHLLGARYLHGLGVPQDDKQAVLWYRKAALQGYAPAQCELGHLYHSGQGVQRNYVEEAGWYLKAAEQGDARAQVALASMYVTGQGVPQADIEAVRWYRKAADHGDASAQSILGFMYDQGKGVPQNCAEAVKWYRKAADQGNARAQHTLGMHYMVSGMGVEQDYAQAMHWYRKAADQGDAFAQFDLGNMYRQGKGIPQDYAEAAKWYSKAADQGNAPAQSILGVMYAKGDGVPQDYLQAHKWFNLAISRLTDAKMRADTVTNRDSLTAFMTPSQIAEAERQVAEWRPADSVK